MKNTLLNKKKFFAQYFGEQVLVTAEKLQYVGGLNIDLHTSESDYLHLKPLSNLREDDMRVVFGMTYHHTYRFEKYKKTETGFVVEYSFESPTKLDTRDVGFSTLLRDNSLTYEVVDYLRSRRYATPFNSLSVDQLIEFGWIKLDYDSK